MDPRSGNPDFGGTFHSVAGRFITGAAHPYSIAASASANLLCDAISAFLDPRQGELVSWSDVFYDRSHGMGNTRRKGTLMITLRVKTAVALGFTALIYLPRRAFPISPIMERIEAPRKKRGRPPSGKKGYFIRMPPKTHAALVEMAAQQVTDLPGLLHQFVTKWQSQKDFVHAKDAAALDATVLGLIYEATSALQQLRPIIETALERQSTAVAWREFVKEFESLMKFESSEE